MKARNTVLCALVLVALAVEACESSTSDSASGVGGGTTAGFSGAGGANVSGAGGIRENAGAGNSTGGTSGTSGSAGLSAQAGAGGLEARGGAGGSGASAGVSGEAGGEANVAGSGDGGASGGEAGSSGEARPERAYLGAFLGGIFAFSFSPTSGVPMLLPGSPTNVGASIYTLNVDPSQRFLYALHETGKLDTYRINADGTLPASAELSIPIAGNPVTQVLDPLARFVYVGTQTDNQNLVLAFKVDATSGALSSAGDPLQLSGAPAYISVDPTGHFAYLTQSVAFGIWGYAIDPSSGALSKIDGSPFGTTSVFRGAIAIEPSGKYLYTSGNGLNGFAIEPGSGKLTRLEGSPFAPDVSSDPFASNLALEPQGKFLYATQFTNGKLFGFAIQPESGKLVPVPGSPQSANSAYSVGVDPSGKFVCVGQDDGKLGVFRRNTADGAFLAVDGSPFEHGGLQPELTFARP